MSSDTPLLILIIFLIALGLRFYWAKRSVQRAVNRSRKIEPQSQKVEPLTQAKRQQILEKNRAAYPSYGQDPRSKQMRAPDFSWFEDALRLDFLNPDFNRCDLRFNSAFDLWDVTATFSGNGQTLVRKVTYSLSSQEVKHLEAALEQTGWQHSQRTGDKDGYNETYRRLSGSQNAPSA